jgi:hypothetical protein
MQGMHRGGVPEEQAGEVNWKLLQETKARGFPKEMFVTSRRLSELPFALGPTTGRWPA